MAKHTSKGSKRSGHKGSGHKNDDKKKKGKGGVSNFGGKKAKPFKKKGK